MTFFSIQKTLIAVSAACLLIALVAPARAQEGKLREDAKKVESAVEEQENQRIHEERFEKAAGPIVLELFTTSDCTACIFADRMVYDAMKNKKVIALSCHINDLSELKKNEDGPVVGEENDYKGPMDPCVFRLWSYQSGRNTRDVSLIIPTFIFNGYDQVRAGSLSYFQSMLNSYEYAYKNKSLEAFMQWKDDDTITIHLPQDPKLDKDAPNASVWLIRYKDIEVKKIDKGVNKGRVLRFSNIIQDIRHIAKWHGVMRTVEVNVPKPLGGRERGGYVVMVQEMMGEEVIAAGVLEDYPLPNDIQKREEEKQPAENPTKQSQ
jgi:hypothetical protein